VHWSNADTARPLINTIAASREELEHR
jgi:hypothetical protein